MFIVSVHQSSQLVVFSNGRFDVVGVYFTLAPNVPTLAAVGDFGGLNCQYTTNVDKSTEFQLTTSPPIVANVC